METADLSQGIVSSTSPEAPAVTQSSVKKALWGRMFKSRCCRPCEESESQVLDLTSLEVANRVNTTLPQGQDQQKARTTEPQEEVTKSPRLRFMEALRKHCPCFCPQSSPGPQDRSLRSLEQPGLEDYSQDPLRSTEQDFSQGSLKSTELGNPQKEVQCVPGGPCEQWDLSHMVGLVYELVSRILQTNKFVDMKDLFAALLQKLHQEMKDWNIKVKADTVHIKEVSKKVYRDLCFRRPRNWVALDSLIRQDYIEVIVLTIRSHLV